MNDAHNQHANAIRVTAPNKSEWAILNGAPKLNFGVIRNGFSVCKGSKQGSGIGVVFRNSWDRRRWGSGVGCVSWCGGRRSYSFVATGKSNEKRNADGRSSCKNGNLFQAQQSSAVVKLFCFALDNRNVFGLRKLFANWLSYW